MKVKMAVFSSLGIFLALTTILHSQIAVDTQKIDALLNKNVLNSQDFQIIDEFLSEAIRRLVMTRDFTSVAKARTIILSRQSTQAQYAQQFSELAYKHISSAFLQAEELPEPHRFKVILNLLILIDGLNDPHLVDLAIDKVKHENKAIRYWAVQCLTNPKLTDKLNPMGTDRSPLLKQIVTQLKEIVDSSSPEVVTLIAKFAGRIKIPEGEDLLLQIADTRIEKYADWTVEYELLDSMILKLLCSKINPDSPSNTEFARRFAQLYSYALQRYINGQAFLSDANKQQLASVLVETEDKCIARLQARPQTTIKRAIERDDYAALQKEHDRLLGSEMGPGELALKLKFSYGSSESDGERNRPLVLPQPPQEKVRISE